MMLGLSLSAFTTLHVIISLIAIVTGLAVTFGMLGSRPLPALTAIFLLFTILTSVTGFLFPFTGLLLSHIFGIVSLVLLAAACVALYAMKLKGLWRPIYLVAALLALYLNVVVLAVQGFLKVPALHALAPGNPPDGTIFLIVQGALLLFFAGLVAGILLRFRPKPLVA